MAWAPFAKPQTVILSGAKNPRRGQEILHYVQNDKGEVSE
jgi:hypothetical protein